MEQVASIVADSLDARLSQISTSARIENGLVHLPLGSRRGIRNWSSVTLSGWGRAWSGAVRELSPDSVTLAGVDPEAPLPPAGIKVRARFELRRLALVPPPAANGLSESAALDLARTVASTLEQQAGLAILFVPDSPDPAEARAIAADAGAEILAYVAGQVADHRLRAVVQLEGLISSDTAGATFQVELPVAGASLAALSAATFPCPAPPGCLFEGARDSVPGALLDAFPNPDRAGEMFALFSDRLETWIFEPGRVASVARHDLNAAWPRDVKAAWPLAAVVGVDSLTGIGRREAKKIYTFCSNERTRRLSMEMSRVLPESLRFSPGPAQGGQFPSRGDSCLARADRVDRPRSYRPPPGLPETAAARLVLREVVAGPSGIPVRDATGRPRTRPVAIVYYDEASAGVWISEPDTAGRLPGTFGREMEAYRPGLAGPPGLLLTRAAAPLEGDHLELWMRGGRGFEKRWQSAEFEGSSITTIGVGDLDGDLQDDILLGVVRPGFSPPDTSGFASRLYIMKSRPVPAPPAW